MNHRGEVSRREWRWVALWIVVALILTSVPYVLGIAASTPDRVFGGATFAVEDVNSYLAKMQQGAHGEWLFHIVYSSEPHDGALLFLFHLLLGKFAALTGLSLELTYHLARVIFGALMLWMMYRFIAMCTGSIAIRRIAFWLATFGGGFGWLLLFAGQPNWLGSPPLDLLLPEGFTFLVLYALPHIALARVFLLSGLMLVWSGSSKRRSAILSGLCWTAMALIVPFYVLVVYAILFGAFVAATLARRRIDWIEVRTSIIAGAIASLVPIYTFVVFNNNPVLAVWAQQNQITSPHPLHYVAAYALVGGLALMSLRWAWRRSDGMWSRLVGWLIVIPPLLYLPFGLQRRLIESWQIPLSMLAAATLVRVALPALRRSRVVRWLSRRPRYSSSGLQRWALSGLLLVTTPTFGLLLLDQSLRISTRQSPIFHDGGEIAALDWLSQHATYDDVVLSAYDTGNYLPARVAARVFVGHGPETIYLDQKLPLVTQFFASTTDDTWRESFLREWGITYVFVGPNERELGTAGFADKRYLKLEYKLGDYEVYRVNESANQ